MVEIKDIVDRESLEVWLKDQPKRSSIVVASRIALRFLPTLWHFIAIQGLDKGKRNAILSVLKQNLVADASSHCPTLAIPRNLEDASARFASELILPGADIPDAAGEAAAFAADAVYAYHYGDAATSMNKVFFVLDDLNAVYAGISSLEFLNIVKIDCEELLDEGNLAGVKLWLEFEDPFREIWGKLKSILNDDAVDWSFWIKWYEAVLNGEPLNWEMLEQIALIPAKDWEQGPERVNGLIAKIEEEFEATQAPKIHTKSIQQAVVQNREGIAPQLDALTEILVVEIERLRGKNPVDEIEQEERDRLKSVFEKLHSSIVRLEEVLPSSGEPTKDEAEEIEGLLKLYVGEFANWPRENAKDMVDSTVRVALVGLTAGVVTLFGASALVGVAIGGVAFGGKKLVGAARAIKESASGGN